MITTVMNKVYMNFKMDNGNTRTIPILNHHDGTPYLITLDGSKNASVENILSDIGVINISVLQSLIKSGAHVSDSILKEIGEMQYPEKYSLETMKEIVKTDSSFRYMYISALSLTKLGCIKISYKFEPVIVELKPIKENDKIVNTTMSSHIVRYNKIKKVVYGECFELPSEKTILGHKKLYTILKGACSFPVKGILLSHKSEMVDVYDRGIFLSRLDLCTFVEYPNDSGKDFDIFTALFKDGTPRTFSLYSPLENLIANHNAIKNKVVYIVDNIIKTCI